MCHRLTRTLLLSFLPASCIILYFLSPMYDDYHFRITEEKSNFSPQDGNVVVEISNDKATVPSFDDMKL